MRTNRLIRKRGAKRRIEPFEIDITSLLDILVIILVFLLKSYNSSGIVLNVPEGIELPRSESQKQNSAGVLVQVSPTKIWVDDKVVYDINTSPRSGSFDYGGRRIVALYNELVAKKKIIKQVEKTAPNAKKFSGVVNLIVDKSVKYKRLKQLLFTCAEAGFMKYKFVVMGEQ